VLPSRHQQTERCGIDHHALLLSTARAMVEARSFIKTVIGRSGLGESRCLELLGLTAQDLAYVDWPSKFMDSSDPDWRANRQAVSALSGRLEPVVRELRPMTDTQLQNYFLEKRVLKLEQQLAALAAK
jgi:hypothetical protein